MPRAPYRSLTFELVNDGVRGFDAETWDYLFLLDGEGAELSYQDAKNQDFPKGAFIRVDEGVSWEKGPGSDLIVPVMRRNTRTGFQIVNKSGSTQTYKIRWGHGDVDHRALLFDSGESLGVEGIDAHNAASTAKPVLAGGIHRDGPASAAVVADGDSASLLVDAIGRLVVTQHIPGAGGAQFGQQLTAPTWNGHGTLMAAAAGEVPVVWAITIENHDTGGSHEWRIKNGTGGQTIWQGHVDTRAAGAPYIHEIPFSKPVRGLVGDSVVFETDSATAGHMSILIHGDYERVS